MSALDHFPEDFGLPRTPAQKAAFDALGAAFDEGARVLLGVVPATDPVRLPTQQQVEDRVLRLLDMLGFGPDDVSDQLVLTPACGMAGASASYAREALALVRPSASAWG